MSLECGHEGCLSPHVGDGGQSRQVSSLYVQEVVRWGERGDGGAVRSSPTRLVWCQELPLSASESVSVVVTGRAWLQEKKGAR